jgi:hypothetical protein
VTHPFHPLAGRRFQVVARHHNWHEDRVVCRDGGGRLESLPVRWTSLAPADPFVVVSSGRACFLPDDLLVIVELVAACAQKRAAGQRPGEGADV